MKTTEYLRQLTNLDRRITNCIKEAERWANMAVSTSSPSYDSVKVQTSLQSDKIGNAVASVLDCQKQCEQDAEELIKLRKTIISQINSLNTGSNGLYCNLLYGVYVDNKNLNELSVSENYSYRQTKRYFNQALNEFEKKYGVLYLTA